MEGEAEEGWNGSEASPDGSGPPSPAQPHHCWSMMTCSMALLATFLRQSKLCRGLTEINDKHASALALPAGSSLEESWLGEVGTGVTPGTGGEFKPLLPAPKP